MNNLQSQNVVPIQIFELKFFYFKLRLKKILWPNNSDFVSSDHKTFLQKAFGLFMCEASNFR